MTKYIIVITPEDNNNTFKNLKNICFLTELINNNGNNFIIEEIYDIGENDFIEFKINISKYINRNKKFIVNIISKELRYEKYLSFYEPKVFSLEKDKKILKNIILIIGVILFLFFIYMYYRTSIRKIIKAKKHKKKIYEENFGLELKDENN